MTTPAPHIEITPRSLAPFRSGNRGVDYVHTLESGYPGPHVVINALIHGNEFCGMVAATDLLEQGFRPLRGRLTIVFANIAAYERFDSANPFASRYVERDMNRVWDPAILDGPDMTVDVCRARELRPIYAEADALLDIHSTSHAVPPMLVYEAVPKYDELARHLRSPLHHILLPGVKHPGRPLIQSGSFGDPQAAPLGIVVECGQHFARASGELAKSVVIRFLDFFGMVPQALARRFQPDDGEPLRLEVTDVLIAKTDRFRFARPWIGFEVIGKGDLIAMDGDEEVRAPYGNCTIVMPTRRIVQGRDVVSLARAV